MKLVILILTCAKHEDHRQACRETWAKGLPDGVAVHFVRGFADTQGADEWLVAAPDTYAELPQKTRHAFLKATKCYPQCQWFFKCDDDSFVCVDRLLKFIDTNPGDYVGHAMMHDQPAFASGGAGYLLSRKAALIVAENMTDISGPEDLLLSRVLINSQIRLTPSLRFYPWKEIVPTRDNDLISTHYQTPDMMRKVWANLQPQRIPKLFHWIWVGGNEMPSIFRDYIDGWKRLHPDWQSVIWYDRDVLGFIGNGLFQNAREYGAAKTLAQKADILRYEILHRHGGVYLDCDFEPLKNIEPLLHGIDGFSGAEDASSVAIGIMGAVPKHPLFAELIQMLPASFAEYENIVNATGPGFMTRHCMGRKDFKIFPPQVWYPLHWSGVWHGPIEGAYAIHRWAHSWKPADSPQA